MCCSCVVHLLFICCSFVVHVLLICCFCCCFVVVAVVVCCCSWFYLLFNLWFLFLFLFNLLFVCLLLLLLTYDWLFSFFACFCLCLASNSPKSHIPCNFRGFSLSLPKPLSSKSLSSLFFLCPFGPFLFVFFSFIFF